MLFGPNLDWCGVHGASPQRHGRLPGAQACPWQGFTRPRELTSGSEVCPKAAGFLDQTGLLLPRLGGSGGSQVNGQLGTAGSSKFSLPRQLLPAPSAPQPQHVLMFLSQTHMSSQARLAPSSASSLCPVTPAWQRLDAAWAHAVVGRLLTAASCTARLLNLPSVPLNPLSKPLNTWQAIFLCPLHIATCRKSSSRPAEAQLVLRLFLPSLTAALGR